MSTVTRANRNLWSTQEHGLLAPSHANLPKAGLVFCAPLWHPELNVSPFVSKDLNAHSCTVTGPTWGIQGRTFAGGDDVIVLPVGASVRGLTQASLAMWFKTDVLDGAQHFLYTEGTNVAGVLRFSLIIDTDNKLRFLGRAPDADGATTWVDSTTALSVDTWYHVFAIFDSVTDTHWIYIDGVGESASVVEPAFSNVAPVDLPRIGLTVGGTLGFEGTIGEVLLYNRAPTAVEVQNHRLSTKWRY